MHTDSIFKYIQHPELLDDETLPEVNRLISTFPYFQTAHLLWLKNQHNIRSLDFNENLRRSAAFIADRSLLYHLIHAQDSVAAPDLKEGGGSGAATVGVIEDDGAGAERGPAEDLSFTGWLSRMTESRSDESADRPERNESFSQDYLIDEFIRNAPSIRPAGDEEHDPTDKSETGTLPDDEPLTETLAGIYVKQGYHRKALATYEKLSLKYPEKSTYFASRIEEIKAEMNKNKKS